MTDERREGQTAADEAGVDKAGGNKSATRDLVETETSGAGYGNNAGPQDEVEAS